MLRARKAGWQEKMDSKTILESYLDRDLTEVLGEKGLHNIISSATHKRLSKTEVSLLAAIIQKQHEEVSLERVHKNISELEFRSVIDGQNTSAYPDSDGDDTEIELFVQRLEKLYNKLENEIRVLKDKKIKETDKLEELTVEFSEQASKSDVNGTHELDSITNDINTFNSSMLNKS